MTIYMTNLPFNLLVWGSLWLVPIRWSATFRLTAKYISDSRKINYLGRPNIELVMQYKLLGNCRTLWGKQEQATYCDIAGVPEGTRDWGGTDDGVCVHMHTLRGSGGMLP